MPSSVCTDGLHRAMTLSLARGTPSFYTRRPSGHCATNNARLTRPPDNMIDRPPQNLRKSADAARARIMPRVKASLGKPKLKLSDELATVAAALKVCAGLPEAVAEIAGSNDPEAKNATREAVAVIRDIAQDGLQKLPEQEPTVPPPEQLPPTDRARLVPVSTGQRVMSREHFNTLGHAQRGRLLAEGVRLTDDCRSANFFPAPERNILGRVEK